MLVDGSRWGAGRLRARVADDRERLPRDRGASLITTDHNLAKIAQALSVPAPSLNALAEAFRVPDGLREPPVTRPDTSPLQRER